jgi:hypothetical protein
MWERPVLYIAAHVWPGLYISHRPAPLLLLFLTHTLTFSPLTISHIHIYIYMCRTRQSHSYYVLNYYTTLSSLMSEVLTYYWHSHFTMPFCAPIPHFQVHLFYCIYSSDVCMYVCMFGSMTPGRLKASSAVCIPRCVKLRCVKWFCLTGISVFIIIISIESWSANKALRCVNRFSWPAWAFVFIFYVSFVVFLRGTLWPLPRAFAWTVPTVTFLLVQLAPPANDMLDMLDPLQAMVTQHSWASRQLVRQRDQKWRDDMETSMHASLHKGNHHCKWMVPTPHATNLINQSWLRGMYGLFNISYKSPRGRTLYSPSCCR